MRLYLFISLFLGASVPSALAADRVAGPIRAEVLRVVDADTIAVRALIWPGQRVEVKVRLAQIDAPELFRPACDQEKIKARIATEYVIRQIGTEVELNDIRFGKYAGRVVANVRIDGGKDLGALLMKEGLAHLQADTTGWCGR